MRKRLQSNHNEHSKFKKINVPRVDNPNGHPENKFLPKLSNMKIYRGIDKIRHLMTKPSILFVQLQLLTHN